MSNYWLILTLIFLTILSWVGYHAFGEKIKTLEEVVKILAHRLEGLADKPKNQLILDEYKKYFPYSNFSLTKYGALYFPGQARETNIEYLENEIKDEIVRIYRASRDKKKS